MWGTWPACAECGALLGPGGVCQRCPPPGMVRCPATHSYDKRCPLCKGAGFLEELP